MHLKFIVICVFVFIFGNNNRRRSRKKKAPNEALTIAFIATVILKFFL